MLDILYKSFLKQVKEGKMRKLDNPLSDDIDIFVSPGSDVSTIYVTLIKNKSETDLCPDQSRPGVIMNKCQPVVKTTLIRLALPESEKGFDILNPDSKVKVTAKSGTVTMQLALHVEPDEDKYYNIGAEYDQDGNLTKLESDILFKNIYQEKEYAMFYADASNTPVGLGNK